MRQYDCHYAARVSYSSVIGLAVAFRIHPLPQQKGLLRVTDAGIGTFGSYICAL